MGEAGLIWCPFPDAESAEGVLKTLLQEGLVACGNCVPGMTSIFIWDGALNEASETGLLLKTLGARLDQVMQRIEVLHPYEQPAMTGWTVKPSPATWDWLVRTLGEGES